MFKEFKELNKNIILEGNELHILVKTHNVSKSNTFIRIEIHSNGGCGCDQEVDSITLNPDSTRSHDLRRKA